MYLDAEKLPALMEAIKSMKPMDWIKNPKLKYIEIRIDTRNGKFRVADRYGNHITEEELNQFLWENH